MSAIARTVTPRSSETVSQEFRVSKALFWLFGAAAAVCFGWLMVQPAMFLAAGPLFLACLGATSIAMIGYMRRLSEREAAVLLALTFFLIDFSLAPFGVGGGLDPQTLTKLAVYMALLVYSVFTAGRGVGFSVGTLAFTGYALFAFSTVVYAPSPFLAAGGGLALLAVCLVPAAMVRWTEEHVARVWRAVFFAGVILAVGSILLYVVMPVWAVSRTVSGVGRVQGLTGAPNSLGNVLAATTLVGIFVVQTFGRGRRKLIYLAGIGVTVAGLLLTGSRTALLALLIGAFAPVLLRGVRAILTISVAVFCGATLAAYPKLPFAVLDWAGRMFSRSGTTTELTTFTGRIDIWVASAKLWLDAPWIGYGLGSPRFVIPEGWSNRWGWTTGTAHNFLLESLLSFGVLGTFLLLVGLSAAVFTAWKVWSQSESQRISLSWLCIASTVFVVVSGLMEKSFAGTLSPNTLILTLAYGSSLVLWQRLERASLSEVAFVNTRYTDATGRGDRVGRPFPSISA